MYEQHCVLDWKLCKSLTSSDDYDVNSWLLYRYCSELPIAIIESCTNTVSRFLPLKHKYNDSTCTVAYNFVCRIYPTYSVTNPYDVLLFRRKFLDDLTTGLTIEITDKRKQKSRMTRSNDSVLVGISVGFFFCCLF